MQLFLEQKKNQSIIINKLNYEYNSEIDIKELNCHLADILASAERHVDFLKAIAEYLSFPIEIKDEDSVTSIDNNANHPSAKVIPFLVSSRPNMIISPPLPLEQSCCTNQHTEDTQT